jgi:molybdopterin-guanine dinucleotide biosynthesis protein A
MDAYAAVVLAGGGARRMGGVDKPLVHVGARRMLDRVLAAVTDAVPRVLVGAADGLPSDVVVTREHPPGGGPVTATAAGLALVGPATPAVALLAADLPLLTDDAVAVLRRAAGQGHVDGACFVDHTGRRQWLCGVWRVSPLLAAVDRLAVDRGGELSGAPLRALLSGLRVREVTWSPGGPPPWFDCDTDDDLRRARDWATRGRAGSAESWSA